MAPSVLDLFHLHNRTALLTGATRGIGAALALALAQRNFTVYATARTLSKIPSSLSSLPNVSAIQLDVCRR